MGSKETGQDLGGLVDHLFRHEAGRMVSALTRAFGTENLETVEDAVQETLLLAMEVWPFRGVPDNPSAWLFRVARNKTIDVVRRGKRIIHVDFENPAPPSVPAVEIADTDDDLLRMMFACCHPQIPEAGRIALILKVLCGFNTAEIARAFVAPEDSISKRLYRAKEMFRTGEVSLELPAAAEAKSRTESVLGSIYLLFNEGYNSTSAEELVRRDLMDEAMRLCGLLLRNPNTRIPEAFALMALMCFHAARTESRLTAEGEIILLPDQDRSTWDRTLIQEGNTLMNFAAQGDALSRYHLEAAIAYEHCVAGTFAATNWGRILHYYGTLCEAFPSPFAQLSMAIATLCAHGPTAAAEAVNAIADVGRLEKYYLYHSLLGEIDLRLDRRRSAADHFAAALDLTASEPERRLLRSKMAGAAAG